MANVASLSTSLTMETTKFRAGVNRAQRDLGSFRGRVGRTGDALRRMQRRTQAATSAFRTMLGPLLAVAGVAGLGLLVKRSIEAADEIGKTADKIGVGVEALQELKFAAEQSGVAQEALFMGLQRFGRRLDEVDKGSGTLKSTIERYNIALRDSEGRTRSVVDVLGDYAEVVKNAESAQERLNIVQKGFDSEGVALVNLLKQGKEGMEELREQARRLGLVLDDSMVRQAERANDQLNIMRRILSVNLQKAVLGLSPAIVRLGEAFASAAPAISDFVQSLLPLEQRSADAIRRGVLQPLEAELERMQVLDLDNLPEGLRRGRERAIERLKARVKAVRELAREQEKAAAVQRKAAAAAGLTGGPAGGPSLEPPAPSPKRDPRIVQMEEERLGLRTATEAHEEFAQGAADVVRALRLEKEQAAAARNEWLDYAQALRDTGVEAMRAHEDHEEFAQGAADVARTLAEQERQRMEALKERQFQMRLNEQDSLGRLEAEKQARALVMEQERERAEQLREATKSADQFGTAMQTALERAIFDGAKLRDVFKFLLADMARIALRAQTLSFFQNLFAPSAEGGVGGNFGDVPPIPRQHGGPVQRGRPYLVGEQGPELFVPRQSGRVAANGGGGALTINVDARGAGPGVEHLVARGIEQAMRTVARSEVARAADARSR